MSDRSAITAALVGAIGAILAALIGAAVIFWPEGWWPRSAKPEPKIFVSDIYRYPPWDVPKAARELGNAPPGDPCNTEGPRNWVKSKGGVETNMEVHFVLTTERPEAVVVIGFRPHVSRVNGSAMHTTIDLFCPGGDGFLGRKVDFAVDSKPPKFTLYDEQGHRIERIGLNLDKGDAVDFLVTAKVNSPGVVYEWTADLELLVGGKLKYLPISNEGKPFRVAGALSKSVDLRSLQS